MSAVPTPQPLTATALSAMPLSQVPKCFASTTGYRGEYMIIEKLVDTPEAMFYITIRSANVESNTVMSNNAKFFNSMLGQLHNKAIDQMSEFPEVEE